MDGNGTSMTAEEFGKGLRQRVEKTATQVAIAKVTEAIDRLQGMLAEAAKGHAADAVFKVAAELRAELAASAKMHARLQDAIEKRFADNEAILRGIEKATDPQTAQAVYASVLVEQKSLATQRAQLDAQIEKNNAAVLTANGMVRDAMRERELTGAIASDMAIRMAELRKGVEDTARSAAVLAVESLTGETRAEVAKIAGTAQAAISGARQAIDEAAQRIAKDALGIVDDVAKAERERAVSLLDAWEKMAKRALGDFEARTAKLETELVRKADAAVADVDASEAPLIPRAYRGPYVDGATYQRGDLTTYLGSTFIATRNTTERPLVTNDDDPAWQLFAAGGFGGGYTSNRLKNGLSWPRQAGYWGYLGGPTLVYERVDNMVLPWTPNKSYRAGDKAAFLTVGGSGLYLSRIADGAAGPVFDQNERNEWTILSSDLLHVADFVELQGIAAAEGALAFIRDELSMRVATNGQWVPYMPPLPTGNELQRLQYSPDPGVLTHWEDDRAARSVVATRADLSDRALLPTTHLKIGKPVWVVDEARLWHLTTDPTALTDTEADWTPITEGTMRGFMAPAVAGGGPGVPGRIINGDPDNAYRNGDWVITRGNSNPLYNFATGVVGNAGERLFEGTIVAYTGGIWQALTNGLPAIFGSFDASLNGGGPVPPFPVMDSEPWWQFGDAFFVTVGGVYDFSTGLAGATPGANPRTFTVARGQTIDFDGALWQIRETGSGGGMLRGWMDPSQSGGGPDVPGRVINGDPDAAYFEDDWLWVIAFSDQLYDFTSGTPTTGATATGQRLFPGDALRYEGGVWVRISNPDRSQWGGFDATQSGGGPRVPQPVIDGSKWYQPFDSVTVEVGGRYNLTTGLPDPAGQLLVPGQFLVYDGNLWDATRSVAPRFAGFFNPSQSGGGGDVPAPVIDGATFYRAGDYVIANGNDRYDFATGLPSPTGVLVSPNDHIVYDGALWAVIATEVSPNRGFFDPTVAGGSPPAPHPVIDGSSNFKTNDFMFSTDSGFYDFATGTPSAGPAAGRILAVATGQRVIYDGALWLVASTASGLAKGHFNPTLDNGGPAVDFPVVNASIDYVERDFVIATTDGWYDFSTGVAGAAPAAVWVRSGHIVRYAGGGWQVIPQSGDADRGFFDATANGGADPVNGVAQPAVTNSSTAYTTGDFFIVRTGGVYNFTTGLPDPLGTTVQVGDVLRRDAANARWDIVRAAGGSSADNAITQNTHGFTVGRPVRVDASGVWVAAQAGSEASLKIATVSEVIDANRFRIVTSGIMAWAAHGLTVGTIYYVSPTAAGNWTSTKPTTAGQFVQGHVVPIDANRVLVLDGPAWANN